ncbi:hypothetical protein HMPREF1870_01065 [Bacteroidales bacterium KA00344]|nr:hypothetical protein HMPREF1870_01065 [Bacteroidales bacterium KA00344]
MFHFLSKNITVFEGVSDFSFRTKRAIFFCPIQRRTLQKNVCHLRLSLNRIVPKPLSAYN